ncbi:serine hydrolase domain-containing protein [Paenibacillus donghaensis]|uniref:Beta-lactamase-related domain-containing protein n=1 Tax=Paenibacillus donghaensis TaxID=414771 RepID=A0A2Z2K409_9BACL|nr:serine hydrolase [Paenibacillus donghaensis]ASA20356.1 hypothetical protein B9T62_05795 [Paenibacillus donghaensis]
MNKNKNNKTRRRVRILTALLTLTLVGEASAFAQQPESASVTSVKQLAALTSAAPGDLKSGPRDAKEVEAFLDAFFAQDAIKQKAGAAAISVVQGGKVLVSKGYGITNPTSKSQEDAIRATFRVGSVSKVFTATAMMQLVDQGKISLQDNIEKYLDGYQITNSFDTPVTIENLLTHTTGFEVREPTDASYLFDPSQQPISLKESIYDVFPLLSASRERHICMITSHLGCKDTLFSR